MPAKKHGPGIKNPDVYEELRDEGASKEKAAKWSVAPTDLVRLFTQALPPSFVVFYLNLEILHLTPSTHLQIRRFTSLV